jgi:hypothetical protein
VKDLEGRASEKGRIAKRKQTNLLMPRLTAFSRRKKARRPAKYLVTRFGRRQGPRRVFARTGTGCGVREKRKKFKQQSICIKNRAAIIVLLRLT